MYCSKEEVKEYDDDDITINVPDDEILENIEIATQHIDYLINNTYIGKSVPTPVKRACIIIVLSLINEHTDLNLDTTNIESKKSGSHSIKYKDSVSSIGGLDIKFIPDVAMKLLYPYIKRRKPYIDII